MQCIFGALFLGLGCNIFLVLRLWCYALSATSRRLATVAAHLLYTILREQEKTGLEHVSSCPNYVLSPVFSSIRSPKIYSLLFTFCLMWAIHGSFAQDKIFHSAFPSIVLHSLFLLSFHIPSHRGFLSLPNLFHVFSNGWESSSCGCPGLRRNDQFPRSPTSTTVGHHQH